MLIPVDFLLDQSSSRVGATCAEAPHCSREMGDFDVKDLVIYQQDPELGDYYSTAFPRNQRPSSGNSGHNMAAKTSKSHFNCGPLQNHLIILYIPNEGLML